MSIEGGKASTLGSSPYSFVSKRSGRASTDLVALSVTMPQHLQTCYLAVKTLKEKYPSLLVAVGGRAFKTSGGIYKTWPIDVYTDLATELVIWADKVVAKT